MDDLKSIVGKHWELNEIVLEDVVIDGVAKAKAEIVFEADNRTHGHGGCNRFTGSYLVKEGEIEFKAMASTKMYCLETMAVEDAFFKAICLVKHINRDEDHMVMRSDDGSTQLVFHPTKTKFKDNKDMK